MPLDRVLAAVAVAVAISAPVISATQAQTDENVHHSAMVAIELVLDGDQVATGDSVNICCTV